MEMEARISSPDVPLVLDEPRPQDNPLFAFQALLEKIKTGNIINIKNLHENVGEIEMKVWSKLYEGLGSFLDDLSDFRKKDSGDAKDLVENYLADLMKLTGEIKTIKDSFDLKDSAQNDKDIYYQEVLNRLGIIYGHCDMYKDDYHTLSEMDMELQKEKNKFSANLDKDVQDKMVA